MHTLSAAQAQHMQNIYKYTVNAIFIPYTTYHIPYTIYKDGPTDQKIMNIFLGKQD